MLEVEGDTELVVSSMINHTLSFPPSSYPFNVEPFGGLDLITTTTRDQTMGPELLMSVSCSYPFNMGPFRRA